jgi:FkbM family methyltransferase
MPLSPRLRRRLIDLLDSVVDVYATKSWSQEGEDMILRRIFEGQQRGFYVDVGAHHPRRFSNTYYFYKRGWQGINIEPRPDALAAFRSARRRDINLQAGVAEQSGTLQYYCFDEPALNTFDPATVQQRLAQTPFKVIQTIDIPVAPLSEILGKHLAPAQAVDFLSIDVEGLDLAVLRSNDWSRFRPRCVLVESLNNSLQEAMQGGIVQFMQSQDYELFGKTFNTLVFRDRKDKSQSGKQS